MIGPILHFHRELSDLISALKEASHKMTPEDRFRAVKEVISISSDGLKKYREENPCFAKHPTFILVESAMGYLSYLYEDAEAISRAEQAVSRTRGKPSDFLKPVLDYFSFIERDTPL